MERASAINRETRSKSPLESASCALRNALRAFAGTLNSLRFTVFALGSPASAALRLENRRFIVVLPASTDTRSWTSFKPVSAVISYSPRGTLLIRYCPAMLVQVDPTTFPRETSRRATWTLDMAWSPESTTMPLIPASDPPPTSLPEEEYRFSWYVWPIPERVKANSETSKRIWTTMHLRSRIRQPWRLGPADFRI